MRSTLPVLLFCLAVLLVPAGCSRNAVAMPRATVQLCAPTSTPSRETVAAKRVLAARLHKGLYVAATVAMGKERGCVVVRLRGRAAVAHVRDVMGVLRKRGQFVEGVFVPRPGTDLQFDAAVRYTTDRVTRANRGLAVVRPTVTWNGIRQSSIRLLSPRRSDRTSLLIRLRPSARRLWMHTHLGVETVYLLDRRIVVYLRLSDAPGPFILIPAALESTARFSPRGAPALYSYLRFGPLPFSWASTRRLSERR